MGPLFDAMLPGRYVIDLTKPWHVAWWAEHFGVSEALLTAAVGVVGAHADVVRLFLDQQREQNVLPA